MEHIAVASRFKLPRLRAFPTVFLPLLARLPPWIPASLENMKILAQGNNTRKSFLEIKTETTKLPNKAGNKKKR